MSSQTSNISVAPTLNDGPNKANIPHGLSVANPQIEKHIPTRVVPEVPESLKEFLRTGRNELSDAQGEVQSSKRTTSNPSSDLLQSVGYLNLILPQELRFNDAVEHAFDGHFNLINPFPVVEAPKDLAISEESLLSFTHYHEEPMDLDEDLASAIGKVDLNKTEMQ